MRITAVVRTTANAHKAVSALSRFVQTTKKQLARPHRRHPESESTVVAVASPVPAQ
ncbi:hypothetical protein KJE20_04214 [Pyrenophora tritici-repentis]|uniref:Uncharacterized protein n=1 Tax=Pyrenophora tritici-repentis TaxID=45151 RepID=A0A922NMB3_9PLEO|nr:hypothetical protein Ptr86124_001800 [Pyrenophora tritici-repentis]KAI1686249.1 hypothetical protein KJE20_04214 [Pyrenophora tritici-repentis]